MANQELITDRFLREAKSVPQKFFATHLKEETVSGAKYSTMDEKIKAFVEKARELIQSRRLQQDVRGGWLPARQLQIVREILSRHGFYAAIAYQAANISHRENKWERIKKEVVLELLKFASPAEVNLDVRITGYLIGKINEILNSTKGADFK
jgi:hypothetical protein